jgi:hypothetical protein
MTHHNHQARKPGSSDYLDYVRHLPEVSFADFTPEPGTTYHITHLHDDWCRHFAGGKCDCAVEIHLHREPCRQ